jgi:hypothetical protein
MVFEMGLRLELQELGLPTVPKEFGQSSPLQDLMSLQPLPSQLRTESYRRHGGGLERRDAET